MTPLRQRMIEDMQVRNLAPHTQRSYVQQISQFARHFGRPPELLGPADIRAYQVHLVQDRQLSASSTLVAVAAIRFLYKVTLKRGWSIDEIVPTCRKPQRLPVVLSRDEVSRFLAAVEMPKHRVILTVCYAAGLRISEAVHLTPAAIDSQRLEAALRPLPPGDRLRRWSSASTRAKGARTATSCSRPSCWTCSGTTGAPPGL